MSIKIQSIRTKNFIIPNEKVVIVRYRTISYNKYGERKLSQTMYENKREGNTNTRRIIQSTNPKTDKVVKEEFDKDDNIVKTTIYIDGEMHQVIEHEQQGNASVQKIGDYNLESVFVDEDNIVTSKLNSKFAFHITRDKYGKEIRHYSIENNKFYDTEYTMFNESTYFGTTFVTSEGEESLDSIVINRYGTDFRNILNIYANHNCILSSVHSSGSARNMMFKVESLIDYLTSDDNVLKAIKIDGNYNDDCLEFTHNDHTIQVYPGSIVLDNDLRYSNSSLVSTLLKIMSDEIAANKVNK